MIYIFSFQPLLVSVELYGPSGRMLEWSIYLVSSVPVFFVSKQ